MVTVIRAWFKRYFSDPQAVLLFFILLFLILAISILGKVLAPVLAGIVIAYLLEWPVQQLCRLRCPRTLAVCIIFTVFMAVLLIALIWLIPLLSQQMSNLFNEMPTMVGKAQTYLVQLPARYPSYITTDQLQRVMIEFKAFMAHFGQWALSYSLSTIPNIIMLIIYLVLVPLMVFFFLKDRQSILTWVSHNLPHKRSLLDRIWAEIRGQLGNYVRGKVIEMIIVGFVTYITFALMDLLYSALLAVLVGLSVLIPFIGAAVVTIPVLVVGFVEWGWGANFVYLTLAYLVIITLDANVLVPLLFSEAVSLHPIAIIVAILFFGWLWGFWGVFFAIPLAAVINATIKAWPRNAA